jgi:twitching motility protein PilT
MIVMRVIPFAVPSIASLGLPEVLNTLADSDRGLLLVTGVSGSGKTSTVAAIIEHINRTKQKHIVTIENPIEFLHRDVNCSVTQREVGVDTESVAVGLRAALRQDPDVILIGETRDPDTADIAVKAAETGHLVISAMPTPDVTTTLERLVAMFPAEERDIGRVRLSEALRGIVSQQLLPRADEEGRVAAFEILVNTPPVRACLKNPAKWGELRTLMAQGREAHGMQTFEQSLADLVAAKSITEETAAAAGRGDPVPENRDRRKKAR